MRFLLHSATELRQKPLSWFMLRAAAALLPVLLCTALYTGGAVLETSVFAGISLPLFIGATAVLFTAACFVRSDAVVFCFMLGAGTLYACFCAAHVSDWLFSFGLCAVMAAAVWFFAPKTKRAAAKDRSPWLLLALFILLYSVFVGGLCCVYYRMYRTPCYDFGLFAQMFYYMKTTGRCLITCERDRLLSHFAVHFSPIYYLFLPAYLLLPDPRTLLVLQAVTVGCGAVPLTLLCRRFGLSDTAALALAVCWLTYPAFMGGCFWYLHENCFLAPLVLWLMLFFEKKRAVGVAAFALLTLAVKEDAAVYVAVIALYYFFTGNNYKCSIFTFAGAVLWFVTVTRLMETYGEGIMDTSRYGDYIYGDAGLAGMVKTVLTDPVFAVKQSVTAEKLIFVLQMLTGLFFLPLAIRRPARLILLLPLLLVNLMTSYVYQYNIGYQYTFGSGSLLFYLAAANYADMGEARGKTLLCAVLGSAILFAGGYAAKADVLTQAAHKQAQTQTITDALSCIPPDASVSASTFLLANLSQRDTLYELERTNKKAQYVAMDLRYKKENDPEAYIADGYSLLFIEKGVVAVLYDPNYREAPAGALG